MAIAATALLVAACGPSTSATSATAPATPALGSPTQASAIVKPTQAPAIVKPTEAPAIVKPTEAPAVGKPTEVPAAKPTLGQAAPFKRPDVAPLPAEGRFQVVSQTAWPGDKVRVFFLGAQF